jgi:hypothetical protein
LLVMSNLGSFFFRSSLRRRRIFTQLTRPAEAGGSNVSLAGLREHAGWLRDRTTHCFKVSLCRAGHRRDSRDAARIGLPGRTKSVPVFALV